MIPFGIHEDWFAPISEDEIKLTRLSLGLQASDRVILCPARLSQQKRHDLLIKAARDVVDRVENAIFLLAGDGELKDDISRWIAEAGLGERMRLLGHRTDIRELITASDIVVLSSDFEGFPYVLMEAAARGTPSVATDVGGVRHSIKHGETGFVVSPQDPSALIEALLALVSDTNLLARFSNSTRQYAEESFAKRKLIENTVQLYDDLLQLSSTQATHEEN